METHGSGCEEKQCEKQHFYRKNAPLAFNECLHNNLDSKVRIQVNRPIDWQLAEQHANRGVTPGQQRDSAQVDYDYYYICPEP